MKFVIDVSFIASLLLPDEAAEESEAQLQQIREGGAVAPTLWQLEVTKMLLTAQCRKRIDASQFMRILEAVNSFPVTLQRIPPERPHGW